MCAELVQEDSQMLRSFARPSIFCSIFSNWDIYGHECANSSTPTALWCMPGHSTTFALALSSAMQCRPTSSLHIPLLPTSFFLLIISTFQLARLSSRYGRSEKYGTPWHSKQAPPLDSEESLDLRPPTSSQPAAASHSSPPPAPRTSAYRM
jgi:hypothetical protein